MSWAERNSCCPQIDLIYTMLLVFERRMIFNTVWGYDITNVNLCFAFKAILCNSLQFSWKIIKR